MLQHTEELFDFDHDGKLNFFEQCEKFEFEEKLIREMNGEDEDDEDELDLDDLEDMDPDERREALEEAGYDPDDFDMDDDSDDF